jgi:lipoprotein-anchoring transpeptidase ErfK/SrfK
MLHPLIGRLGLRPLRLIGLIALCGPFAQLTAIAETATHAAVASRTEPDPAPPSWPRPVETWLEAQIALARIGFSSGPIDGVAGSQSASALKAYQLREGLRPTGQLDAATRNQLRLTVAPLTELALSVEAFGDFHALSATWLGKSQQPLLGYETALEWAAECSHAHPALIRQLNPAVDWSNVLPGAKFIVPAVGHVVLATKAAQLHVQLAAHVIEACDEVGVVIAHFPVSIARRVEKRPEGTLFVTVVVRDPDYTFDPDAFPESIEGAELGRKLRLPAGPNNPVGVAWIGLSLPSYGIHGTPLPEHVGRTESHGCFRVANWDALTLVDLAWVGLPVIVDP